MKISVVQTQQPFTYDPAHPGDFDLDRCRRLAQTGMDAGFAMIEQAAREGADLIVTIEAFNSSLSLLDERYDFAVACEPLDGPVIKRFAQLAAKYACYIVAGLYTTRHGKAYNSGVLFGPDGRVAGVFDKVHLPAGEDRRVTPGDRYPVFPTEHGNVGILICWDMQYPEAARELALGGADLIALPTWGWENVYGLCRAYENSVTVAAAMGVPCGQPIWSICDPSCIVDHLGRVLAVATREGPQIISAALDIRQEPAPQYGSGELMGMTSMRRIRTVQRRPGTYRLVNEATPPLMRRYLR